jgi:hypothetical protein
MIQGKTLRKMAIQMGRNVMHMGNYGIFVVVVCYL